ncbi:uncharacterized protein LOC123293066 [Chrysoperla carnea]|uniref:uncharacterized protein LOC123293066 n=1 Tax=Chrysoperla carnea TaxID=189513 RepID=UPI001D06061B|nr:uncharacterized protein LOC123293066 [Chrysoperla carnea]
MPLKYQCCVPMCNSSKKVNSHISFHKFPSDNEAIKIGGKMINRRQLWIENLKLSNINVRTRVCSLHFKESDFFKAANKKTKSLFLKRIAIPSINNEKSEYPTHPSCIPSMFPKDEINKNVINETQTTEMVDFNNIDLNKVCEDPTRSSYIPSILHVDEINKNARNEIRTTEMVDFKNINYDRVCRGCLSQDDNLKSMNESIEDDVHDNNILLSDMFMDCTSIRIDDNDNLPKQICDFCVSQINQLYLFKKNFIQ